MKEPEGERDKRHVGTWSFLTLTMNKDTAATLSFVFYGFVFKTFVPVSSPKHNFSHKVNIPTCLHNNDYIKMFYSCRRQSTAWPARVQVRLEPRSGLEVVRRLDGRTSCS